jgi:hypothetical protein
MNKEFVSYEQALELKSIGFDKPCLAWATLEYPNTIHVGNGYKVHRETDLPTKPFGIPTFSQAFRFFREKYKIYGSYGQTNDDRKEVTGFVIINFINGTRTELFADWEVGTYEEAELACLVKLIEIVKSK